MSAIKRTLYNKLRDYVGYFPVTAILGPRQCGKTTLAKAFMADHLEARYLDLERPSDLAKLSEPESFLRSLQGHMVCLDEIQRCPDLFPVLRSIVDETANPGQFIVLGSASPDLLRQSSETLAGRIGYLELTPLTEAEVGSEAQADLWFRGGFPRSFLAPGNTMSKAWLRSFTQTFLERDLPQLGIRIPSLMLRRFWEMCAHMHGDLWNHAKIAASLGVSGKTVAHYLDILEQAYMLRRLPPYHPNTKKRLVKSPRVYLRDSGILHHLLRIEDMQMLSGHPVRGTSWEGYVIEQVAAAVPYADLTFYRTAAGAEIDLIVKHGSRLTAIEIKASAVPRIERGFWQALDDIQPETAWVAAQVNEVFSIGNNVNVAPVQTICQFLSSPQQT